MCTGTGCLYSPNCLVGGLFSNLPLRLCGSLLCIRSGAKRRFAIRPVRLVNTPCSKPKQTRRARPRCDLPKLYELSELTFRKEAGILVGIPASRKLAPREQVIPLAGCRSRLVDLIRALGRVGGAHVYGRADFLELKLIGGGAVLENVGHVLGVAGVAHTLDIGALGGVVALLGGREGLIELAALAFLLFLLGDLGYGWDGSHRQHSQKRRQQHQLLQLLPPILDTSDPLRSASCIKRTTERAYHRSVCAQGT